MQDNFDVHSQEISTLLKNCEKCSISGKISKDFPLKRTLRIKQSYVQLFVSIKHGYLHITYRGRSRDFEKGEGALYVGRHGWPTKKILGFRWSKKAKTKLEIKSFG